MSGKNKQLFYAKLFSHILLCTTPATSTTQQRAELASDLNYFRELAKGKEASPDPFTNDPERAANALIIIGTCFGRCSSLIASTKTKHHLLQILRHPMLNNP